MGDKERRRARERERRGEEEKCNIIIRFEILV